MIRVLLVDDQPVVRRGLRVLFRLEPDLQVVGEASTGTEALALAQTLTPDVVLMDIEMPEMDGIEATAALRRVVPQSAVVILSIHDDAQTHGRAQEAQAARVCGEAWRHPDAALGHAPGRSTGRKAQQVTGQLLPLFSWRLRQERRNASNQTAYKSIALICCR
jgi:chemotaxis response regulator CheB